MMEGPARRLASKQQRKIDFFGKINKVTNFLYSLKPYRKKA